MAQLAFDPSELWLRKVKTFDELIRYVKPNPIVFAGDSIIQHFRMYELIPGYYFLNRGIDGDTTTGLMHRLKCSVLDLNPDKVFIHIGVEDIPFKGDEEILSNYKDILIEIIANNPAANLYVISILPTNGRPDMLVSRISFINSELERLSHLLEINYINAFPLFCNINEELKPELTTDGLNLNQVGYNILAKTIKSYL
jgi:lysophospholipase L1-like esterase